MPPILAQLLPYFLLIQNGSQKVATWDEKNIKVLQIFFLKNH